MTVSSKALKSEDVIMFTAMASGENGFQVSMLAIWVNVFRQVKYITTL
jgi:hypothetical protein